MTDMSAPAHEQTASSRVTSGITIEDLRIVLTGRGNVDVVDDIDLVLRAGEVVGLVGESGSGKTTVGTSLLGYTRAGALIERGKVLFEDKDVLGMPWQQVRQLRGEEIAYVPQDPAAALNPSIRIGKQIVELMELRGLGTSESRLQGARDGLKEVGLPYDDEFLRRYAHQLSGGQVQRVALAMAFLPKPKVLVLDEPTTGLDVTTQGMVLQTMGELCRSHGVAALYVTHDLAVIANIADRVAVMYAGQIAELGDRTTIFSSPSHPYTRALLDSIPHLSQARALSGIPGRTPAPGARPGGCRFHDRCGFAEDRCSQEVPELREVAPGHAVRCVRAGEIGSWDISRGTVPDADPSAAARDRLEDRGPRRLLRPQAGRLRRLLRRRQGRGGRPGRRVGLRQDHDLALRRRPAQGVDRRDRLRGHRPGARLAQAQRRGPQADPVHLPEPLPLLEPAADDRADRQAAHGAVRHRLGQGRDRAGRGPARPGRARPGRDEVPGQPALRR